MDNTINPAGLLRLAQIIGDKASGTLPLIPISRSGWWQGVSEGRFPQPVRLGRRCTAWRAADILALIERLEPSRPTRADEARND